ncbi:ABC transporter substrate-binding protein [Pseudorhodoplanes sp.]|uniref:ABC transporter substrate-binding protein n=1 Tax=Pseudorhodoplanes sp. TaxID=1934341 RepID=UPI003919A493
MRSIARIAQRLACIVIAGSVTSAALAETPKRGGVLRHVVEGEPANFDCHAAATSFALQVLAPHYSTLLKYDTNDYSKIVGGLADSWTVSPDRLTYTFKLKPGVKFHDGSELTSADIKATFDRIRNPPEGITSARRGQFSSIDTIETPSADTVVFKLKQVNPAALYMFANPWNCVYSAKKLGEDPNWYATNVMGTGPYVFEEYVKGSHWSAKRFDNYFEKGKPYLDGVRAFFINGPGVVNALAGGQVDALLFQVAPPDRSRLRSLRGDQVAFHENSFNITNFLTVNVKKPPFNDVRVRRALSLAIDRWGGIPSLAKLATLEFPTIYVPPASPVAYSKEEMEKLPGLGRDMDKQRAEAKKLLAEAGVPNLKLTLLNRNVRLPWQPLGIYIMDQWRQIGIEVDQIPAETPPYFAALTSGNYDVAIDFNNTVSVDPNEVLVKFLPGSPNNYSGAEDKVLVDLFNKQADMTDPAERKKVVRQFLERLVDESYFIPLFGNNRATAAVKEFKGWKLAPTTVLNLDMSEVWFDR